MFFMFIDIQKLSKAANRLPRVINALTILRFTSKVSDPGRFLEVKHEFKVSSRFPQLIIILLEKHTFHSMTVFKVVYKHIGHASVFTRLLKTLASISMYSGASKISLSDVISVLLKSNCLKFICELFTEVDKLLVIDLVPDVPA